MLNSSASSTFPPFRPGEAAGLPGAAWDQSLERSTMSVMGPRERSPLSTMWA